MFINSIVAQIKRDFPDLTQVKMNVDLINVICDAIEENVKVNGLTKVNKLELFFKIYGTVFQFDGNERNHLIKIVDYLNTNDCIKVVPLFTKIYRFIRSLSTAKK